ncbi:DUF3106 domain-containing protein [Arenimonas caeni]|jgi:DNA-directed RNA polymerase specialized sigma24 family protein|uniref:RNA polymerase sigma factor 70 region 4 type 2 domain-containing protein n=1 Tax=Arenimonas caeni TaxID=2058085 RepID=A0A2P6M885_9GAMM|nr:DUF3106 domain-containing protein [Arenimonas caeni]MDY0021520.1 DUF3106 domain-containing protein [Arenimonas caeni]PRH82217.1 hypothetical protein C6N40_08130 [Arenimonas caeni]
MRPSPTPSSALAAFLRGIERRAFVFADLQCGEPGRALAAVEHAMRAFVPISGGTPLSAWPASFWSLLLAQTELSGGEGGAPELARLGSGPRAALLLRLVGGLDYPHAAKVLGVAEPTYRFALQRALQQLADAEVSYAALGRLRERLHRQVKTLGEERVAELATIRARALAGEPAPEAAPVPPASPWPRRLAWAALVALGLAFAATWWKPQPALLPGAVQDLPAESPGAQAPADPADADADRIIHPDYAALAVPEAAALAGELPFLSWLAAEASLAPVPDAPPAPAPLPAAAVDDVPLFQDLAGAERPLLVPVAGNWPGLEPATRRQLLGQARHWLALDDAGRAALRARLDAWDALPPAERASRRGALAAWAALSPEEQARVAASDAAWRALDEAARGEWRARFEALPVDQRQPWWLGPALGEWFSPVQPLFAYVPGAEREPLLAMLRALPPPARDDLAMLARRLPADEREKLRRELLEAAPGQREALVRERLAQ